MERFATQNCRARTRACWIVRTMPTGPVTAEPGVSPDHPPEPRNSTSHKIHYVNFPFGARGEAPDLDRDSIPRSRWWRTPPKRLRPATRSAGAPSGCQRSIAALDARPCVHIHGPGVLALPKLRTCSCHAPSGVRCQPELQNEWVQVKYRQTSGACRVPAPSRFAERHPDPTPGSLDPRDLWPF
jgi:hypothetical protein